MDTLTQLVDILQAEADGVGFTLETMRATPPIGSHND